MRTVRVKICGLTDVENAVAVANAGADAIGLVFYAKSSRYVGIPQAAAIADAIPPFVQRVGLFVNESPLIVTDIINHVSLDLLQFHGDEDSDYCCGFDRPYIKAIRMKPGIDVAAEVAAHPHARGFLLDAYTPGVPGGTGECFNWQEFPQLLTQPLILAGGLTPLNVDVAISACNPYAVDVSGGVEASPGMKSLDKVAAFIRKAKLVEV